MTTRTQTVNGTKTRAWTAEDQDELQRLTQTTEPAEDTGHAPTDPTPGWSVHSVKEAMEQAQAIQNETKDAPEEALELVGRIVEAMQHSWLYEQERDIGYTLKRLAKSFEFSHQWNLRSMDEASRDLIALGKPTDEIGRRKERTLQDTLGRRNASTAQTAAMRDAMRFWSAHLTGERVNLDSGQTAAQAHRANIQLANQYRKEVGLAEINNATDTPEKPTRRKFLGIF